MIHQHHNILWLGCEKLTNCAHFFRRGGAATPRYPPPEGPEAWGGGGLHQPVLRARLPWLVVAVRHARPQEVAGVITGSAAGMDVTLSAERAGLDNPETQSTVQAVALFQPAQRRRSGVVARGFKTDDGYDTYDAFLHCTIYLSFSCHP